ncbi:hypothetical protein ACXET9_05170 [Brachybacterium sp. DNPG3]
MPDTDPMLLAVLAIAYLPPAVVLSRIDAMEHRLPNRWVLLLTASTGTGLGALALLQPAARPGLRAALVLAVLLGLGAIVIALIAPPLLGMGDAKTVPVVVLASASLGGEALVGAMLGAILLAGALGALVLAVSRRPGTRFALGPVLLAAPFLGLLGAPTVSAALGT